MTEDKRLKVRASYLTKRFALKVNNESDKKKFFKANNQTFDFWSLRNVNLNVYDGECIGIIGLNGAGKSTLVNLISEIISPTTGNLQVNGEVSTISIGAGLQNGITGRENIRLKSLMMGMSNKEIDEQIDEIIAFSELGPFIDELVKNYSSGMKSKLGFSIAVYQNPDILIIDEALSVGDSTFAEKSSKKMFEFRQQRKTIFVVSHDINSINKWCDRVLWLHYGEVKELGSKDVVLEHYKEFINWYNNLSAEQQAVYKEKCQKEQLDYSLLNLREEISDTIDTRKRSASKTINKILDVKDGYKLSLFSKVMLGLVTIIIIMLSLIATSNWTMQEALGKPYEFFTEGHLFHRKPTFERELKEIESSESKSEKKTSSKLNESTQKVSKSSVSSSTTSHSNTSAQATNYTVKAGDTLGDIAAENNTTVQDIEQVNPNTDLSVISPGEIINLPGNSSTTEMSH